MKFPLILPAFALFALLSLPGFARVTAETRDQVYSQAEADRLASRFEAAAAGYLEVAQFEPRNGHVWVRRAICLKKLGRYPEAMLDECRAHAALVHQRQEKLSRAISLANRADSAQFARDFAGAIADGLAATKVDETYARAYQALADAWYGLGNLEQAQAYFAEAKKRDGSLSRTFDAATAAQNARTATSPDDNYDCTADFTAAVAAAKEGKHEEAVAIYNRILARQPLNDGAWGNRGNSLRSLGRFAESVISESRAAALSGAFDSPVERTANHFANRLSCWLDLGDVEAALVDGEIATRAAPDFVRGWQRLSTAHYHWGSLEKAQAAFAEAKKRDASLVEPRMTEAGARAYGYARLARLGDRDALVGLVEAAVHPPPDGVLGNPHRTAAIAILDAQLLQQPRDANLLILRGQAENTAAFGARIGTAEEALPWLDRAIAAEPKNGRAYLVRGLMRLDRLGDDAATAAGYADLDRAFELGAATPEALSRRANHRAAENNFAGALADLDAALAISPDHDDYARDRASILESSGNREGALAAWARLIERHPEEARNYRRRAELHAKAAQWPQALADFDAAIAREPGEFGHHLGRAAALRALGRGPEAKESHAKARGLDTSLPALAADLSNAPEIEALRNDFKHSLQRASAAVNRLNDANIEVMKAKREARRAQERLSRLLSGDDRTPDAVIAEVTERETDGWADADDFRDRARARAGQNDLDGALADLDRALGLDSTHAESYDLRGRLHEIRKELEAAFTDYDRAVSLAPDNADFHRDRGDIHWERKDFAAALTDYESAVEHGGTNATNWFKRGNARFMLDRFQDAIADYDKALELQPDLENATTNRARAREFLAKSGAK